MAKKEKKVRWIPTYEFEQFAAAIFELRLYARMTAEELGKEPNEPLHPITRDMLAKNLQRALDKFASDDEVAAQRD